jgi:hypothetical protein
MAGSDRFDVKAFQRAKFSPREAEVTLDAVASAGFGTGVFKVRGLTAEEIHIADEAKKRGQLLSNLVEKLASGGEERVQALLEGVGVSNGVPADLVKQYEHVRMGLIEPTLEHQDIIKFAEIWPVEFIQLANKVMELTGLGRIAEVKPAPSGGGKTSKPA